MEPGQNMVSDGCAWFMAHYAHVEKQAGARAVIVEEPVWCPEQEMDGQEAVEQEVLFEP
jgi:hypothetical protein